MCPKQTRWRIKRELDQSINNINRAIDDMVKAGHEFEGVHPDYYVRFCMIAQFAHTMIKAVEQLRDDI